MTLSTTLKELFTDEEKSTEMMHGECSYDPEYPTYDYTKGYSVEKRVQTGTEEMANGYGKELTEMGVSFKEMDSYGGEDQGSDYWHVWEFTRGEEVAFFEFGGWYASHHGAEFENVFEVKPVQKTVTVYQNV